MNEKDDRIKKAIESIEPDEAVKARMLEHIKQKAAAQAETEPKPAKVLRLNALMKWALPVAACLVIVVALVFALPQLFHGAKSAENYDAAPMEPAEMANPWVTVKDSESLQESTGIAIDAPAAADRIAYSALGDELADVTFTLDGHEYTLRASKRTDDFSGLYGEPAEESSIASTGGKDDMVTMKSGDETYRKITWMRDGTTYILTNTDGASEEAFLDVYESLNP